MEQKMTKANEPDQLSEPKTEETKKGEEIFRREALAILARHSAYTAPAVLTILSVTAKRATAGSF